jgi:hypothetical protein
MATDRRQLAVLVALLAVLGVLGYRQLAGTSRTTAPASNQTRRAAAPAQNGSPLAGAPDVHLDALNTERPKPAEAERNLFRFKPKAPPPPPAMVSRPVAPENTTPPPISAGPPTTPPIALKFIGTMNSEGKTIAVLTDGQGPPMFGIEGQTIAGRYRILRIGAESIEMSYLDGRGRQTIRLTGQ